MTKKELAALLGISGAMVTRHSKRGMPTDSLERALRWRKRHLEPGRVKGTRFDSNYQPIPQTDHPVPPVPVGAYLARARGLLNVASLALSAGGCVDELIPGLRAALAAVPAPDRNGLLFPQNVMDLLTADVAAQLPRSDSEVVTADMTDAEADSMGLFWYGVAAGEWRAT